MDNVTRTKVFGRSVIIRKSLNPIFQLFPQVAVFIPAPGAEQDNTLVLFNPLFLPQFEKGSRKIGAPSALLEALHKEELAPEPPSTIQFLWLAVLTHTRVAAL